MNRLVDKKWGIRVAAFIAVAGGGYAIGGAAGAGAALGLAALLYWIWLGVKATRHIPTAVRRAVGAIYARTR